MAAAILACGILIGCHAPLSKMSEASNVEIRLARGVCFGGCPVYAVAIAGDGAVTYEGASGVALRGRFQERVAPADVAALLRLFERADFLSLQDEYIGEITDSPTYSVSLTIGGRSKTVRDHVGKLAGMPDAVTELEDAIDRTAGTAKWVKGTPETIPLLRQAGFDFTSAAAATLLADALEIRSYAFASRLIEAGIPLDGRTTDQNQPAAELLFPLGRLPGPDLERTSRLFSEAAVERGTRRDRNAALVIAAGLDDADLVQRLIALGADSDAMTPKAVLVTGAEDVALLLAGRELSGETRAALIARAREKGWTRLLAQLGA